VEHVIPYSNLHMDVLSEDGGCRKTEEGHRDIHRLWNCANLRVGREAQLELTSGVKCEGWRDDSAAMRPHVRVCQVTFSGR
jgi:hypothetical protein